MINLKLEIQIDSLTTEEKDLFNSIAPSTETFNKLLKNISEGKVTNNSPLQTLKQVEPPVAHKRLTVRFLKPLPSIIGVDMKSYGPFLVEDVASVPTENAKALIKQGLAKAVDLQP